VTLKKNAKKKAKKLTEIMPLLLTRTSYYNYYYTIVQKCISTKDQSLKKQKKKPTKIELKKHD